jgi:hypothetical protein
LGTGDAQYLQFIRPPRIINLAEVDAVSSASEAVSDVERCVLELFALHYPECVSSAFVLNRLARFDVIAANSVLDSLAQKGLLERIGDAYKLKNEP